MVNTAPLRFSNEFVRHKILDIMGDFYLLGQPIRGHIRANMTGHTDNVELVRQLQTVLTSV
jgi:UDP-3-O-acyl-N-acetylglucosamine deacetylase